MSTREQLQARLDEAKWWHIQVAVSVMDSQVYDLGLRDQCRRRIAELEAQLAALPPESAEVAPPWATIREVLRKHWLSGIRCHHKMFPGDEESFDQPQCACSEIDFPKGNNVGEAVEMWINHVLVVAACAAPQQHEERTREAPPPDKDLQDALMFLRIFMSRKNMVTVECLEAKVLDWMKRKGYEPSVLRAAPQQHQESEGR
jgi:hypothetical protein